MDVQLGSFGRLPLVSGGPEAAFREPVGDGRVGGAEGLSGLHPNWYPPVKFAGEWLAALALLVLTSPLVLAMAALVRLTSSGPAFYFQTRLGRGGRHYRICKLRTMRHDCEARTGAVWSVRGDVRITPIGRILRDTHLDELPQLFNVLCGHMALIGPRPERPEIVCRIEREVPDYRQRLRVRPGVTGLAQMRLPADVDVAGVRRKLAHDLDYIRRMSPVLDLRIAAATVRYFVAAAADAVRTTGTRSAERDAGLLVEDVAGGQRA